MVRLKQERTAKSLAEGKQILGSKVKQKEEGYNTDPAVLI